MEARWRNCCSLQEFCETTGEKNCGFYFSILEGFPPRPLPSSPHNKNELFLPLEALLAASAVAEELQHQLPETMLALKLSLNCHACVLYIPVCLIMIVDMNIHSAHGKSFIDFTDTVGSELLILT